MPNQLLWSLILFQGFVVILWMTTETMSHLIQTNLVQARAQDIRNGKMTITVRFRVVNDRTMSTCSYPANYDRSLLYKEAVLQGRKCAHVVVRRRCPNLSPCRRWELFSHPLILLQFHFVFWQPHKYEHEPRSYYIYCSDNVFSPERDLFLSEGLGVYLFMNSLQWYPRI